MVKTGKTAPDFTLAGAQGDEIREVTLSEFAAGRPAVLVFYVNDFSPVCTEQMCEVNDMEMLTFNDDVAVLGISTDSPYSHRQFITQNTISYPLLTDLHMSVYEQYGFLEQVDGRPQPKRGVVLVDSNRTVQYRWEAEGNWDDWTMEPLRETNEIIEELTAATTY